MKAVGLKVERMKEENRKLCAGNDVLRITKQHIVELLINRLRAKQFVKVAKEISEDIEGQYLGVFIHMKRCSVLRSSRRWADWNCSATNLDALVVSGWQTLHDVVSSSMLGRWYRYTLQRALPHLRMLYPPSEGKFIVKRSRGKLWVVQIILLRIMRWLNTSQNYRFQHFLFYITTLIILSYYSCFSSAVLTGEKDERRDVEEEVFESRILYKYKLNAWMMTVLKGNGCEVQMIW